MPPYHRTTDITIIGGGLSAIYAFWGCIDAGFKPNQVKVMYDGRTSLAGAIFMYSSPIPWPSRKVTSVLWGTCDQYSLNQWDEIKPTSAHRRFNDGDNPVIVEHLFIPEELLTTLWGMIPCKVETPLLTEEQVEEIKKSQEAVICTFPSKEKKNSYNSRGYLTGFPIHIADHNGHDSTVIYNGLDFVPWVRQTTIPGKIYTEYDAYCDHNHIMHYESNRGNIGGTIRFAPDLHPDCPPLTLEERTEDNLFRVGRYSAFQPGYLSHQARGEVKDFLMNL